MNIIGSWIKQTNKLTSLLRQKAPRRYFTFTFCFKLTYQFAKPLPHLAEDDFQVFEILADASRAGAEQLGREVASQGPIQGTRVHRGVFNRDILGT